MHACVKGYTCDNEGDDKQAGGVCTVLSAICVFPGFSLLFPFSCHNATSNIWYSTMYAVNPQWVWSIIKTIFGELVILVVNPPWHG